MALIDLITDGTDSIDLADAFDGFTDKYSYKQQIVEKNALGEYPQVTEQLSVTWNQLDDDERADEHQKLMRLKRKANKWGAGDFREGPVWRKLQSNSEDNPKYMVLTNVRLVELGEQFYGPDTPSKATVLEITREGAPRLIEPTASRLEVVAATTVYDYVESSNKNYLTITPGTGAGELPGDADALLWFRKVINNLISDVYEENNQLTIAKKTASTEAELNAFETYLAPTDINGSDLDTGMSLVTDANTPGGEYLRIQNAGGSELTVDVFWRTDAYEGNFNFIAPIKMVGSDDYAHVAPIYGYTGSFVRGAENYVPTGYYGNYQKVYVGNMTFPDNRDLLDDSVWVGFSVRLPASSECHVRALWLIPADEGIFEVRAITNTESGSSLMPDRLFIDGERKETWTQHDDDYIVYPIPPEANGNYLMAAHQRYTRLYFFKSYWDETNGIDLVWPEKLSYTVTIEAIPRVKALAS